MKYVAFLDILGFKEKLKKMKQSEAVDFIREFSSTAYREWKVLSPKHIDGYIVSDSFIISTKNCEPESLSELISVIISICQKEFSENGILVRGGIAKGEFDKIKAEELSTLRKGLIVGQAYIDAYLLEGTIKIAGIILQNSVYEDVENLSSKFFPIKIEDKNKSFFVIRYLSIDYLLDKDNLSKFISLAKESKWIPHYYNTICFLMQNESNDKKISQIFSNIFEIILDDEGNWRDVDNFIKNAFGNNVMCNFQTRFLKYIRNQLKQNENSLVGGKG